MANSLLEEALYQQIQDACLPLPKREFKFDAKRKWRFDFAWDIKKVACEVNGGTYSKGRHSTGVGLDKDYEKLNEAQLLGWSVFQFSSGQVLDGYALLIIERALNGMGS